MTLKATFVISTAINRVSMIRPQVYERRDLRLFHIRDGMPDRFRTLCSPSCNAVVYVFIENI